MRKVNQSEVTPELTGNDAPLSEAYFGSSGDGLTLHHADVDGYPNDESQERLEEDPSHPRDIRPDKVGALRGYRAAGATLDDEEELSVRPEHFGLPIPKDELPSEDLEAATDDDQAHRRAQFASEHPSAVR